MNDHASGSRSDKTSLHANRALCSKCLKMPQIEQNLSVTAQLTTGTYDSSRRNTVVVIVVVVILMRKRRLRRKPRRDPEAPNARRVMT